MNEDGTPGELLLPWRTCARLLGGARYMGSIQLPRGSENWLFKRPDGRVVMVLWNLDAEGEGPNDTPIEEVLYLGEDVHEIDIWGGTQDPPLRGGRHVVHVGRMPRFVLGLNEAIAEWRIALQFEEPSVPSVFAVTHPNAVLFNNTFGQGVGGRVRLFIPSGDAADASQRSEAPEWQVTPREQRFSLAASERTRAPIDIVLREAGYGDQPIRIDFRVTADREHVFSVWRQLTVGLGDLELDVLTTIDATGKLTVEQQMRRTGGRTADFKCSLFAPGRRRKRAQVFQLGEELDKKRYTYLDAADLIGEEMRLRVEEIDGPRKMIHRFRVERADVVAEPLAPAPRPDAT